MGIHRRHEHQCTNLIERVQRALDGRLSLTEEKAFLEEITECDCCLETYRIEKSFRYFLTEKIAKRKVKDDLVSKIKDKISSIAPSP